jgi:hypothetical protein
MAKTKRTIGTTPVRTQSGLGAFDIEKIIPVKYLTAAAIAFIAVLFLIFYAPILFEGQSFHSGDIVTGMAIKKIKEITGGKGMLWNPFIFCGLPSQFGGVGYERWFDIISTVYTQIRAGIGRLFGSEFAQHITYLFVFAINAFAFMRSRKANILTSLFVGIAAAFSTGIVVFLSIGHITKLDTVSMIPLVFLILLRMQEKIRIFDVVLCVIALDFMLYGWHAQVIFYAFFAIGLYFLFFIIKYLAKKDFTALKKLVLSGVLFVFLSGFAFGTMLDVYAQMAEYTDYSTRGSKSLAETESQNAEKANSDFYEYATNWSFSPGEVLTFIVPSFYGFGNVKYDGPLTDSKDINTYFGQMMFVDVAMYMGVIVFFLALFAMVTLRKDPLVQFLTILVIIAIFISFGRTFPVIFDLMFNYFPKFDKFRVPSMILVIPQIFFPILAGLGLMKIIKLKEEHDKLSENIIKYAAIAAGALFVLFVVLNGVISDWFIGRIVDSQKGQQLQPLGDFMAGMFEKDLLIACALVAAVFGLAYAYLKGRVSADILAIVIVILTVFDLFRISSRGIQFVQNQEMTEQFAAPEYIKTIDSRKDDQPFRLLNLKQDGSYGTLSHNSNYNMYFQKQDLYGYSGIKPRTIQDYFDIVTPANPTLWRMLNVKYIILERAIQFPGLADLSPSGNDHVYLNTTALPRAYFVNKTEVKSNSEILKKVKDNEFDPKEIAYTEKEVKTDKPDSTAAAKVLYYGYDTVKVEANATGRNFLFLGDTYYPHGWKAYEDGKEIEIYKANYGFRGVVVSPGKHVIEFVYAPKSYTIGKAVSLIINLILVIGLLVSLFLYIKERKIKKIPVEA